MPKIDLADIEIKGIEKDKLNPNNYGGMCSRAMIVKAGEADPTKGIKTIATTNQPAIVIDWDRREIVREVLPMKYYEAPDNDKTPLLDAHMRYSIEHVKGSAINWQPDATNLNCLTTISSTEVIIITKYKEGHIDSVSLGYLTDSTRTIEIPQGTEVIVDGVGYRNDFEDGIPFLVRLWWKPKELSLVPIGADNRAKLKEDILGQLQKLGVKSEDPALQEVLTNIFEKINAIEKTFTSIKIGGGTVPEPKPKPEGDQLTAEELRAKEAERIIDFGKTRMKGKYKDLAERCVKANMDYDQFNEMVIHDVERTGSVSETPLSFLDLTPRQLSDYSITRAGRVVLDGKDKNLPASENASFEFECSRAIEQKVGHAPKNGNLFLAHDVYLRDAKYLKEREHSVSSAATGAALVETELRDDLLVEALQNDLIMGRLGATILTGLQGNLEIPKIVSTLTAQVVAENTAADTSFITLGKMSATPHNISANTEYGRQWFYQSSRSVDQMLLGLLQDAKNLKVDWLALHGTGVNEPLGFMNIPGISAVNMTSPTWRKILSFQTLIMKANALKGSKFKWVVSPDVLQECLATLRFPDVGSATYMNDDRTMVSYQSEWTNQVGDQTLGLGNWSQAFMMFWGIDELLINPYAQGKKGVVELVVFTMFDFLLRMTQPFAISDDYALSA